MLWPIIAIMKEALGEMKEEPDQRCQQISQAYIQRNEKVRIVIICCSLLAMVLAFAVFVLTNNVLPLFITMILTFLGYQYLDASLRQLERMQDKYPV